MHDSIRKARQLLTRLEGIEKIFEADARKRDNTFEPLRYMPPTSREQTKKETQEMTQDWSGWDSWASAHVQQGLERAAGILGDEVGRVEAKLLKRIKQLEQAVGELRAEQTVERTAKEVISLPNWRKQSDSAA
jgi:hypothetical protein